MEHGVLRSTTNFEKKKTEFVTEKAVYKLYINIFTRTKKSKIG